MTARQDQPASPPRRKAPMRSLVCAGLLLILASTIAPSSALLFAALAERTSCQGAVRLGAQCARALADWQTTLRVLLFSGWFGLNAVVMTAFGALILCLALVLRLYRRSGE